MPFHYHYYPHARVQNSSIFTWRTLILTHTPVPPSFTQSAFSHLPGIGETLLAQWVAWFAYVADVVDEVAGDISDIRGRLECSIGTSGEAPYYLVGFIYRGEITCVRVALRVDASVQLPT